MNKRFITILISCLSLSLVGYSQGNNNYNSNRNVNVNNNSNTVIINNQPVQERVIYKTEYIEKYRPIYIEKPQPKRIAKALDSPVCLEDFLWVYPKDLGKYDIDTNPLKIINQINEQGKYGRDSWRIPTSEELRLMENFADQCGLGDDIYLATNHSNGILRLVSTGKTIAEKEAEMKEAEMNRQIEANRLELQRQRNKQEQEQQERRAAAAAKEALNNAIINQQNLVQSGAAVAVSNCLWDIKNKGAKDTYDKGVLYLINDIENSGSWRLPSQEELNSIIRQGKKDNSYLRCNDLVLPLGAYAIRKDDGKVGFINLQNGMVGTSYNTRVFVRYVQDKLY